MQQPFVARMAMDRPEGLAREPWLSHLQSCAVCHREASSHVKSLAVFQAVEQQILANRSSALTWESFVGVLEEEKAAEERARSRAWWGIPIAATAAGVLAVVGVMGWDGMQEDTTAPARIVRVQPHEQRSMEQMMRWTLDSATRRDETLVGDGNTPDLPDTLEAEMSDANLPEGRELAASVPAQPDTSAQPAERAASGRGQISPLVLERRLPPTQPASNRFGRGQPLFRLEHHLVPTQVVSFSEQE